MNYLCETHKKELSEHPEKAEQLYQHWLDCAHSAASENQMQQAVNACGCAFDAAQLLLDIQSTTQTLEALQRLVISGSFLAKLYRNAGQQLHATTLLSAISDYLDACRCVHSVKSDEYLFFSNHLKDVGHLTHDLKLVH